MFKNTNARKSHGLKIFPNSQYDPRRADSGLSAASTSLPGGNGRTVDHSDKRTRLTKMQGKVPGELKATDLRGSPNPSSYDTADAPMYRDLRRNEEKISASASAGNKPASDVLPGGSDAPVIKQPDPAKKDAGPAMMWGLPTTLLLVAFGAVVLFMVMRSA